MATPLLGLLFSLSSIVFLPAASLEQHFYTTEKVAADDINCPEEFPTTSLISCAEKCSELGCYRFWETNGVCQITRKKMPSQSEKREFLFQLQRVRKYQKANTPAVHCNRKLNKLCKTGRIWSRKNFSLNILDFSAAWCPHYIRNMSDSGPEIFPQILPFLYPSNTSRLIPTSGDYYFSRKSVILHSHY